MCKDIVLCEHSTGDHIGSPLRRRDKLRFVPILGDKISHTLRCPSFSAKSHVCECYVLINAHINAFAALPTFHGYFGESGKGRNMKCFVSEAPNGKPNAIFVSRLRAKR